MKRLLLSTVISMSAATASLADDLAIIIANDNYRNFPGAPRALDVAGLEFDFRAAGFNVNVIRNTGTNVTAGNGNDLLEAMNAADRLVIILAGHMVKTHRQNWLLHSDAKPESALTIGLSAIPLEPFLAPAANRPGQALVVLADTPIALEFGTGVREDVKFDHIPQGVTVISGPPQPVASFIANEYLRPGQSMALAKSKSPESVQVTGYVPSWQAFVAKGSALQIEQSLWQQVRAENTIAAYDRYLRRYPNGRYAAQAAQRRTELSLTPQDRARIAEEQLNLSRDTRRAIQRQLTLLGFDTRGVDGLFGINTRAAIRRWQASVGNPQTGYLSANQINRIEAAAAVRAEQLRREAEERRLEAERRDRAFWNQTGALGSEDGLRAYLKRYPDGLYTQIAVARLKEIERERRRQAELAERAAWDKAVMAGTVESYRFYMQQYPQGLFVKEANARIHALLNPETPKAVIDAARAEEQSLNLNLITRRLIERQLTWNNLDPGPVDGKFTKETRRALRKYQRATNQPVTGFVTRATISNLLASAIK